MEENNQVIRKSISRIESISNHLQVVNVAVTEQQQQQQQVKDQVNVGGSVDYYGLNDLLNDKERLIRKQAKQFAESKILPIANKYYEKAEFPFELIPLLKQLKWAGGNIKGYQCPGMTATELGMIAMEFAKVSADIATFYSILQTISMLPIYYCGSELQKLKYLPKMAAMDSIGCFGLTEPLAGSDASGLLCEARKVDNGWILNGEKRWIGNAPFADIIIVWARDTESKKIKGFIVEKGTPGLNVETINNKISLRMVQNGHIYFKECLISDDQRLPNANDFNSGPGKCLFLTRIMAAWISLGVAANAYESCFKYVQSRKQFGTPLSKFQLIQERLVKMLGNLQAMTLMCLRVSHLFDQQKLSYGQIGLLKAYCTSHGREIVSLARECVGGNGIVTDYGVARSFVDMEAIHTFEGSYDINTLIAAREITGHSSFR
ncbi:putative acyl-CoA oxidase [Cavenderia fasciculata]|uniref:Acyl-CoA oxidase n=1 Tax=Cavenderia fasciculata TaxID=261658 RepID=F4PHG0_CACFS|nr:putative acyl-CoA oxidase [Cavenderia fasciculata]EGG25144.1 putative acyl-CoA oxidase [Cavenderia fasciculata]|eukprot:XP_004362995.1 putative acyl-CoA oxidase [Cavenderia fasciculata]